MGIKMKWHMRQLALAYLTSVFSVTGFILIRIGIKFWKYVQYGGELRWHNGATLSTMLDWFYQAHVNPVLWWIPLALLADLLLHRFVYRLDE